jgi:hypothetical protein
MFLANLSGKFSQRDAFGFPQFPQSSVVCHEPNVKPG